MWQAEELDELFVQLQKNGVTFLPGLTDEQVTHIQEIGAFQFPPDLRAFLQRGVPVSHTRMMDGEIDWIDDSFPNWHQNPQEIIDATRDAIFWGFCFDIDNSQFWLEEWGERPSDLQEAFRIAQQYLRIAPTLIPVFAHRYLPDEPNEPGNPVFSMLQPIDVIYYGFDLQDYLRNEFLRTTRKFRPRSEHRNIPFWSALTS